MARSYRVESRFNPAGFGRVVILLADSKREDFWDAADDALDDSFYLTAIIRRDGALLGWELANAYEQMSLDDPFPNVEEPKALLIDPVFAPEGATLTALIRRIYERRGQAPMPAGVD